MIDFALANHEKNYWHKAAQSSSGSPPSGKQGQGMSGNSNYVTPVNLSTFRGDTREVATNLKLWEGGNDGRLVPKASFTDLIYNDIQLDREIFDHSLAGFAPTRSKFGHAIKLSPDHEDDYAVFKNSVMAFVFRDRVWARLAVNRLK